MTTISAAEYQNLKKSQPNKPVKQHKGSNAGKARPQEQVLTTGTIDSLNGYSDVKQDLLDKIQELYNEKDQELNHLTPNESLPVWNVMRMCRHAMEIVKILKI